MYKNINQGVWICLIIISLLIGVMLGYAWGFSSAISWGVHAGVKLIQMQKINISIDEEMIKTGIMQYKNNIGGCLFTDAPIHSN